MKLRVVTPLLLLLAGGCAHQAPLGGAAGLQVLSGTVLPAPERADLFEQNRPYLIGPFDRLTIDVFGIPELSNKEVQTDAGGRISFPIAGVIEASGKTPGELEEILEDRLRAGAVREPQVTINLKETVSQVITVDGEVREPGLYPVVGRMTLMRAIATAKGTSEFAKLTEVVVFRTVGGQKMAALYDLKAIRRGVYPDPEVYANDVVVMGDSPTRRLIKNLVPALPVLMTPVILALQN